MSDLLKLFCITAVTGTIYFIVGALLFDLHPTPGETILVAGATTAGWVLWDILDSTNSR